MLSTLFFVVVSYKNPQSYEELNFIFSTYHVQILQHMEKKRIMKKGSEVC